MAQGAADVGRRSNRALQVRKILEQAVIHLLANNELAHTACSLLDSRQRDIHLAQLLLELSQIQTLHQLRRIFVGELGVWSDMGRGSSTGDIDKFIAD